MGISGDQKLLKGGPAWLTAMLKDTFKLFLPLLEMSSPAWVCQSAAPAPWISGFCLRTTNTSASSLRTSSFVEVVDPKLFSSVIAPNDHPPCASRSRPGRMEGGVFSSSALSTVTSSLSAVLFNISACASSTKGELPRCRAVGNIVCNSQCMTIEAQNP